MLGEGSISLSEMANKVAVSIETGEQLALPGFSEEEIGVLTRGVARLARFGKEGMKQELRLLVDGEYTYMIPGISALALGMMMAFNKEQHVIWKSSQCCLSG